ncbi:MAG: peptide-methionine (S)-S-oxide reductase MsrA, partial [bacterium]|nr:peptide-methionine (S)-S-oxide reductase MsrA [bacterium]
MFGSKKSEMVSPEEALPGRSEPMPAADVHFVNGTSIYPPFPDGTDQGVFGMGCFWGAERIFWQIPGVYTTAAGYAGGYTPNPNYEETCTGRTGHTEAVLVIYDPEQVGYQRLLKDFWEQHDPTQYMGQGNDRGSQYRSAIYTSSDEQLDIAKRSRDKYQGLLDGEGFG